GKSRRPDRMAEERGERRPYMGGGNRFEREGGKRPYQGTPRFAGEGEGAKRPARPPFAGKPRFGGKPGFAGKAGGFKKKFTGKAAGAKGAYQGGKAERAKRGFTKTRD